MLDFLDLCDSNPCQNGGTCEAGICKCTDAFTGAECETGNEDSSSKHMTKVLTQLFLPLQISVIQTPARMVGHAQMECVNVQMDLLEKNVILVRPVHTQTITNGNQFSCKNCNTFFVSRSV